MPTRASRLDDVLLSKSPGLSRRTSFLSRRSNSRNVVAFRTGPVVPMEVLEEILKFYTHSILASARSEQESQRIIFSRYVKPLMGVSRDLRYVVLREFFNGVRFISQSDATAFFYFLMSVTTSFKQRNWSGGFVWVKSLTTPAFLVFQNAQIIKRFMNLKYLCIDCSHCSLASQFSTFSKVFDALAADNNVVPNVISLTMTNLPRLDDSLLTLISRGLPQLADLQVSTVEGLETDCCPNCYEESLTRVMHSPIHEIYQDSELLATSFAAALKPFSNLKTLYLGVFLSRSDLLDKHATHGTIDLIATTVKSIAICGRCEKYAGETRRRELAISLYIASRLKSLECISWISAYCSADGKEPEDNVIERPLSPSEEGLPFRVILANAKSDKQNLIQTLDDQLHSNDFKVAKFNIWRNEQKIRLVRVT